MVAIFPWGIINGGVPAGELAPVLLLGGAGAVGIRVKVVWGRRTL